jgi:hypothetical protein
MNTAALGTKTSVHEPFGGHFIFKALHKAEARLSVDQAKSLTLSLLSHIDQSKITSLG